MGNTGPIISSQYMTLQPLVCSILENILMNLANFLGHPFGVCRDPADYWPNIHLVYAGVRRITNWIFINWARWIGIEYLIVGMIRLSGPE
jgi:hypothetical protein